MDISSLNGSKHEKHYVKVRTSYRLPSQGRFSWNTSKTHPSRGGNSTTTRHYLCNPLTLNMCEFWQRHFKWWKRPWSLQHKRSKMKSSNEEKEKEKKLLDNDHSQSHNSPLEDQLSQRKPPKCTILIKQHMAGTHGTSDHQIPKSNTSLGANLAEYIMRNVHNFFQSKKDSFHIDLLKESFPNYF